MKAASKLLLGAALVFAITFVVQAAEAKKVTLTGNIVCGKCTLKKADECTNVLQVKVKGKIVNYWIKDEGKGEKYHSCRPNSKKAAKVTGVVKKEGGKMWITDAKVELIK
jgi:hypothetical protein